MSHTRPSKSKPKLKSIGQNYMGGDIIGVKKSAYNTQQSNHPNIRESSII